MSASDSSSPSSSKFSRQFHYFQDGPRLGNPYLLDTALREYLHRVVPQRYWAAMDKELTSFGALAATTLVKLSFQMEANPPKHVAFDVLGNRVDRIETCAAWNHMRRVTSEQGLIASAYERRYGEYSRLIQFAKLLLWGPSSGMVR
jgi:hypothetical protein